MEVSSRRLAIVQHRHPPARGLLSLITLLSAFLLTGIKRIKPAPITPPPAAPPRAGCGVVGFLRRLIYGMGGGEGGAFLLFLFGVSFVSFDVRVCCTTHTRLRHGAGGGSS